MANWYCTNCSSYKDSWAEYQNYKPDETYRRDIRCWSCNNWSLTYTDSQKSEYKSLVRERVSISSGYVAKEAERFSTWWSNNIATAVTLYNGYYRVFLLVYDPAYSTYRPAVFPHDYDSIYWGNSGKERKKHNCPPDAKSEASWLRGELMSGRYSDNPILLIHPSCDFYRSFNTFITEPYVVKKYSTSYLKPLDIVKTDMVFFDHVGVYLGRIDGEYKVCHYTRKRKDTTIDWWSSFLEGGVESYHPVIPFKNYKDICGHIVWAKDNHFRRNNYDLHRRNCEHFANMVVYGINFSEQIEKNRGNFVGLSATAATAGVGVFGVVGATNVFSSIILAPATGGASLIWGAVSVGASVVGAAATSEACERINDNDANGGKRTVNLRDEIRDTNIELRKKFDYETEKYEIKYLQEIPPKENCWVM